MRGHSSNRSPCCWETANSLSLFVLIQSLFWLSTASPPAFALSDISIEKSSSLLSFLFFFPFLSNSFNKLSTRTTCTTRNSSNVVHCRDLMAVHNLRRRSRCYSCLHLAAVMAIVSCCCPMNYNSNKAMAIEFLSEPPMSIYTTPIRTHLPFKFLYPTFQRKREWKKVSVYFCYFFSFLRAYTQIKRHHETGS